VCDAQHVLALRLLPAVFGLVLILTAGRRARNAEAARLGRLSELDSGAEEGFFEERRELESYAYHSDPRNWRAVGACMIAATVVALLRG